MPEGRLTLVVVAHPGRQHSHEAAQALHGAGWLAGYWSGVPCLAEHGRWVPRALWRRMIRYHSVNLPRQRVHWFPWPPVLRKVAGLITVLEIGRIIEYWGYSRFDHWAARKLKAERNLAAVIAYENSALETFKIAKSLGLVTILDAASFHHSAQSSSTGAQWTDRFLNHTKRKKDLEISLADHIITASEMARQTYLAAGVPPDRVHEITLGADLHMFSPGALPRMVAERPMRALYVGKTNVTKGIDILLAAFKRANHDGAARLELVGPAGDAQGQVERELGNEIEYQASKSQPELVGHYRDADCLVLPSRFDSFGMVVAEALACGLPVIVSDMVGAKSLVTEGENGWVVPVGNVEALAQRLRWCIEHRQALADMRASAAQSAQRASWPHYHQRLIATLGEILQGRAA